MRRKILSILLALCMTLMLVPTVALAAGTDSDGTFTVDGIRYLITGDSTVSVISTTDINDPWLPPGAGLGLGPSTYSGEISISESVQHGDKSYSVTGIHSNSFAGTSVTRVSIPSSVTIIGTSAFGGCEKLTEVQLSEGLQEIGSNAFRGCLTLSVLDIPSTVTKIGTSAFGNCNMLMSLNIPAGVTDGLVKALVGNYIYQHLDKVTIAEGSPYEIEGGVLYKGTVAQLYMGPDENVVVREGTTGFASAETGDFDNSVGILGVFSQSTTLKSVTLPNSLESIPARAFHSAVKMESVVLPEGITAIEEKAFYNTGLLSVDIPDSVESIGRSAFEGSIRMTDIELPSKLKTIGEGAFVGSCMLNSITIPEGVTAIPKSAFEGCESLESVSLPEGITSIGEFAFSQTALKAIVIPDGVTTIPQSAFGKVKTLETIVIPASVTNIGQNAFSGLKDDASNTTLIMQGTTAPTFDAKAFGSKDGQGVTPAGLTVIVPGGAESAYMGDGYILKDFIASTEDEGAKPGVSYQLIMPETAPVQVGDNDLENTTITIPDGATVEFSSGDESVATAKYENGKIIVTGVKCGSATITVSINLDDAELASDSCEVTVVHNLTKTDAKAATCTETGNTEYWTCSTCDKMFSDAAGTMETDIESVTIEATRHSYGTEWKFDETNHWHECVCGEKAEEAAHTLKWITDKEATATEKGSKHQECSICSYMSDAVEIPATGEDSPGYPGYQIIEGANGTWTQNTDGTLTFRANGDFAKFTGVKVDGKAVDPANYTAKSGSTIVTLKADYLKTLSAGEHKLTVAFDDGECSTNFTVKAAQSTDIGATSPETGETSPETGATSPETGATSPETGDTSPETGDSSNIVLWLILLAVSLIGIVATLLYVRKRKGNR